VHGDMSHRIVILIFVSAYIFSMSIYCQRVRYEGYGKAILGSNITIEKAKITSLQEAKLDAGDVIIIV
jgi:hypothetical protein